MAGMTVFTTDGIDFIVNDQNTADEFSSSLSYLAGDFVYYTGELYRFRVNHSGAWSDADVEKVLVMSRVERLDRMGELSGLRFESGYYDMNDGTKKASGNRDYFRSVDKYPSGITLYGWDTAKSYSFMSLWKEGVYVGYVCANAYYNPAGQVVSNIDHDEIALSVYQSDYNSYMDVLRFVMPGGEAYNIARKLDEENDYQTVELNWESGVYSMSTGETETNAVYTRSTAKFPKSMEKLLTGWDYTSEYSFMSLYCGSVYVGTKYASSYHNPSGSVVSYIYYDKFALNKYTSDPSVIRIMNAANISKEISGNHVAMRVTTAQGIIDAVQTAINNEASGRYYDITIAEGTYELWSVLDKSVISGSGNEVYHRGLELPDRCNLYGEGNVTIKCTIPESDNSSSHPYTTIVSTLNLHNTENIISGIHFIGNNTRYCIHDDSGFGYANKKLRVERCKFTHNGTESSTYMPDPRCIGAGYLTGRIAEFENCIFVSDGNVGAQLYVHTHEGQNNLSNCSLLVKNCAFITANEVAIDFQVPWNTTHPGVLTVDNCYFASGDSILLRGEVGSVVYGGGNSAVTITNQNSSTVYLVP